MTVFKYLSVNHGVMSKKKIKEVCPRTGLLSRAGTSFPFLSFSNSRAALTIRINLHSFRRSSVFPKSLDYIEIFPKFRLRQYRAPPRESSRRRLPGSKISFRRRFLFTRPARPRPRLPFRWARLCPETASITSHQLTNEHAMQHRASSCTPSTNAVSSSMSRDRSAPVARDARDL